MFVGIAHLWQLTPEEEQALLGRPSIDTYRAWKAGEGRDVPGETLRRIVYVAGIFKALELLYSDAAQAGGWIRRPNRAFSGQMPLERMIAGDVSGLTTVRAYLDAARNPWS